MWARIDNNVVMEITDVDPAGRFHESLVWVQVEQGVACGYQCMDGGFSKPDEVQLNPDRHQLEALRLVAYADPVNGSDRYFAEVLSLQAEGFAATSTEVKEVKAKGLARKLEIQTLYPYPEVE